MSLLRRLSPAHFLTIQAVMLKPEVGNSWALWESVCPVCPSSGGQRREITTSDTSSGQQRRSEKTTLYTPLVNQSRSPSAPFGFCVIEGLIRQLPQSLGIELSESDTLNQIWFSLHSYLTLLLITHTLSTDLDAFPLVSCPTAPPAGRWPPHKCFK